MADIWNGQEHWIFWINLVSTDLVSSFLGSTSGFSFSTDVSCTITVSSLKPIGVIANPKVKETVKSKV